MNPLTTCNDVFRKLALSLLILLVTVPVFAGKTPDLFGRQYRWSYEGKWYRLQYEFAWETYDFYQEKERTHTNYAVYTYENPRFQVIPNFAHALACEAEKAKLNRWETIGFFTAFVQQLAYVPEKGEYPKFPVETLADKGGDCEDTSILLAALLRELGYDVVLVNPPGHMAVALACRDCDGISYQRNGRDYYFIETTGPGYAIGEVPKEYKLTRDRVISLNVPARELAVLDETAERTSAGKPVYYVREDDVVTAAKLGEGTRLITNRILHTVNINGYTFTTSSVTRWVEEG